MPLTPSTTRTRSLRGPTIATAPFLVGFPGPNSPESGSFVRTGVRRSACYYDFQKAVEKAIKEEWGPVKPSLSVHAQAARAAEADFQRLKDWCEDRWHYVGVVVRLLDQRGNVVASESCWRIESDTDYWKEVAAGFTPLLEKIHEEETKQATFLGRLLTCPELNTGELSESTRNLIAEAKAALAKT